MSTKSEINNSMIQPISQGGLTIKPTRIYSTEKVTFLEILEPFINVKIDEIIQSKNRTSANIMSNNKEVDVL